MKLLRVSPPRIVSKETGVDYTQLRDFLAAKKWLEADEVTYRLMLKAAKRKDYLRRKDIENFPCEDLRIIDQLWVKYSNGKFGFSVQKQIWQECGSPMEYNENWEKMGERVGWRKGEEWVGYSYLTFDLDKSLIGELPGCGDRKR